MNKELYDMVPTLLGVVRHAKIMVARASVEPCNPHVYGGFPLWCLCEEEQHCSIVGNRFDNPELLKNESISTGRADL